MKKDKLTIIANPHKPNNLTQLINRTIRNNNKNHMTKQEEVKNEELKHLRKLLKKDRNNLKKATELLVRLDNVLETHAPEIHSSSDTIAECNDFYISLEGDAELDGVVATNYGEDK